jgi:serine/threonine protein kinase
MKPERWKQIEQLYNAALKLDVSRRAAFLDQACDGDEDLRREIASLLASDAQAGSFLAAPAVEVAAKVIAAEPVSSPIGRRIGHYQVLSLLGAGGMGEIYLAEDTQLGRKVALKLLPIEFTADAGRVRRFAQEARAASALNHPNIITIHEIGEASTEAGSTHYIVTEYVEGETLRQRMLSAPQQRIEASEAIDLALQIAAALAAAHEAGITHRDIKPENVMVRRDGIVKVLDFGLAKLTETASGVIDSQASTLAKNSTEAGVVMGTPRYMSPEQARGEKVDARTDIFSLGVMLYEMAAGRAPFAGTTSNEVIAAILRDSPPPLAECAPDAPPEMERILSRALRKDREERYQAVSELLADLKRLKRRLEQKDELKDELARAGQQALEGEVSGGDGEATLSGATLKQAESAGAVAPAHTTAKNWAGGDDIKHETKSVSTGRRWIILVGVLFTLMSVSIGVNSYHSILYFSTAGDPGWLPGLDGRVRMYGGVSGADVSALRDGDELVSLDGQKFGYIRQYFQTFARLTPGAAYTLVVRRDGRTEQLQLRTASYHLWIQIIVILLQLVLPATFLLVGLTIFLLRRDDKRALLLALMLGILFMGGWPPFSLLVTDLPWWLAGIRTAALLAGLGVSPVTLHFFLIFPERSPLLVRFPRLEYYLYPFFLLTACPFIVITAFRLARAPERFFQGFQWPLAIFLAVGSIYLLSAFLSLVVNYRKGNQVSRRKLRLILVGTLIPFIPGTLVRFLFFILKPSPSSLSPLWLAVGIAVLMTALLFPLSFAYAIVRHQVIPVSLVIRRSLQYLLAKNALRLLLALPLVGLAGAVYANRYLPLADLLFHNSVWFYASLLAAVVISLAYRHNLREWLDRRFFREAYQQDRVLRELTEEVRQLDSLTEMARRVSQKVDAALHPERLYLFYREEGRRDLSLGYSSGGSSRDLCIPAEFELLRFLEYQGGAQNFPFPAKTRLPPQEKKWLASLGASLIVPMRGTDDRLTGLLVLGPKKSEIPYTGSDRQLLEMLADQIALVYENAQLKERVAKDRRVQHEV